jgi:uncharacterized protein
MDKKSGREKQPFVDLASLVYYNILQIDICNIFRYTSMQQQLIAYLQQQIRTMPERLKRFTHAFDGREFSHRLLFEQLDQQVADFLSKKSGNNLVIMPGFRGVGKTTLMAQLSVAYTGKVAHLFFLSVEDIRNLFDVGIAEIMLAVEVILGEHLESIKNPILFFLDEIQSDPKWAITLKSLFDKTSKIFFCCSGSSALVLQTTTDLARRAIFNKVFPLSFLEFELIKNDIAPCKDKDAIKKAIYFSKTAKEVYQRLLKLQPMVNNYWSQVSHFDIRKYLSYGSLPFAFLMPDEAAVYDSISLLIDRIVRLDLPTLGRFNVNTLGAVKRILFAIAENDVTSLSVLEEKFHINRLTIANIFDALEKAEMLIKIPAYGSNMSAAKKTNKYLFIAPAIRMSFFYVTGQLSTYLVRQGKLLEDAFGSHLNREFVANGLGSIRYDSAQGGADFILQLMNNKQIIIEIGIGKKDKKQIVSSAKRIKSDYNLIFADQELQLDLDLNLISIPLAYFFLM